MNTLIATNTLLLVIVICIVFLGILWGITLFYVIGIVKRTKRLVKEFDDDVYRARSVVLAMKDIIIEKIFGKDKHHK